MITIMSSFDSTVLNMGRFLTAGVYTCTVTNSDGRSAQGSVLLYGSLDGMCVA